MFKACIFDLDGVIVDTAKYHFIAWRRLANELGFDFDEAFNENLKGVSRMDSLNMILNLGNVTLSESEKVEWATQKNEWYKELIGQMTADEILPGVIPLFQALKANQIKIGLGSASKNAVPVLTKINFINQFDTIVDGTKTTKPKPDPQVFLMGATNLGVQPTEAIVFEDAAKGVTAANAGGFYSVGVGSPDSLGHANHVISGMDEISFEKLVELTVGGWQ